MSDAGANARITGRIGGLTAWATVDPDRMLHPAWAGKARRYERLAREAAERDGRTLTPGALAANADRLRRSEMLALALRSAAVRRERAGKGTAVPAVSTPGTAKERDGDGRRPLPRK